MQLKTVIIMGLTSLFDLVGCTKAQIEKQVFNLDNPVTIIRT